MTAHAQESDGTPKVDTELSGGDLGPPDDEGGWTPRLVVALIMIVLLGELAALSYNLVATALPGIGAEFSVSNLGWVITLPNLVSAVAIAFSGKLADLKGKRLVLIVVCGLAALGGVISALATSYPMFLAGRGLQGLMFVAPVLGYSLIRDVFPRRLIAFAATVTFSGFGATFILAPFLAGWLIDSFGPLAIFWFIGVYLAVCLVGVVLFVPESPLRVKSRLNWQAAALLGLGGALIIYGLGEANVWGWTSPKFVLFIIGGLVCMAGWILWDTRHPEPLIDMGLLRSRPIWTTVVAGGAIYATAGIVSSIVPSMIQTPREVGVTFGFGTDAFGVALYMVPLGGSMVVAGLLCGSMAAAWGVKRPVQIGCALLALGAIGLAFWHSEQWQVMTALAFFGAGMGATYGGLPNLVIQAAPPETQGISAAIANVAQNLGTSMLIQVVFGILAGHAIVTAAGSFFDSTGLTIVYLIAAGCAVVSFVVSSLVPHGSRANVINVKTGGDAVREATAD